MRFIGWICKAIVVLAILALWGVSAVANFAHALQLAGDSDWNYVIAGASAGSDVLKAGATFMVVAAWRRSMWLPLVAALLIWTSTTSWSVNACFGFISETLLATQTVREAHSDNYEDLRKAYNREETYLATLQSTVVKSKRDRVSLRNEIVEQRRVVEKARKDLEAATPVTKSDGVTDTAGHYFDWITPDVTRTARAIFFLLLMELASNFGFLAFSALVGDKKPKAKKKLEADLDLARQGLAVAHQNLVDAIKAPEPVSAPAPAPKAIMQPAQPKKPEAVLLALPTKKPSDPKMPRAKVQMFVTKLVATHGDGAKIVTTDVQKEFADFMGEVIDPSLLGRWLNEFGINRTVRKDNKGKRYYELPKKQVA